jgi:hypothetical protein
MRERTRDRSGFLAATALLLMALLVLVAAVTTAAAGPQGLVARNTLRHEPWPAVKQSVSPAAATVIVSAA